MHSVRPAAVDSQIVAAIRKGLDLIEESIAATAPHASSSRILKIYIHTGSKSHYYLLLTLIIKFTHKNQSIVNSILEARREKR
jgi:hypothetical protein